MTDLGTGLAALKNTHPAYQRAKCYFTGDTDETFSGQKMQRQLAKAGGVSNLRLNFSQIVVEAVADRIDLQKVTSPDAGTQAALDALWKSNKLDLQLPGIFQDTLMFGNSFLILDGDADTGISLFYNSPLNVQIVYSQDNPWVKLFAIKQWACGDPLLGDIVRVNLYYPDRIERYWAKGKGSGAKKATDFQPYVTNDPADTESVIPNPYGFIPVYEFRTGLHSTPEHKEAYGPQDAINKLAITHIATIDYLGWPQRYYMINDPLGAGAVDDFDADLFHDEATPLATDVGPDLYKPAMMPGSGLTADPGSVWALPGGTQAGQFAAADSKNFLDSLDAYIRIMAQVTNTPVRYFTDLPGNVSGETLRVSDSQLVKKVQSRIAFIEAALLDVFEDALSLLGIEGAQLVFHWEPVESNNSTDTWQVVGLKLNAGVSNSVALTEVGYTPDQLKAMGISPDEHSTVDQRIAQLADIGKALQGFSLAVTAGIVSTEQVNAIVESIISSTSDISS